MCIESYEVLPIPLNDPSITPTMMLLAKGQQWQPCDARTNSNIYWAEISMAVRLWLEPWALQLGSLPADGLYTYVDSTVHGFQTLKLFKAGDSFFLLVRQLPSCCIEVVSLEVSHVSRLDLIADFGQNRVGEISVNVPTCGTFFEAESIIRQEVAAWAGFGNSSDKSRFIIETFRGTSETGLVIPFLLAKLRPRRMLPSIASTSKVLVKKLAMKKLATAIK